MITVLERPVFMDISTINTTYEGKWVLVMQPNEKKFFNEGEVVAFGEHTDEVFNEIADMFERHCPNKGFMHYAHIDEGEYLHVVHC